MKKMVRSHDKKYLGGVCGGIANVLDIDPALARMAFVFLLLATGLLPGVVAYLFGWGITPMSQTASPFARWLPKRKKGIPTNKENVAATVD